MGSRSRICLLSVLGIVSNRSDDEKKYTTPTGAEPRPLTEFSPQFPGLEIYFQLCGKYSVELDQCSEERD
jgi:hypothetical protein